MQNKTLLIVLGIALVGGAAYFIMQSKKTTTVNVDSGGTKGDSYSGTGAILTGASDIVDSVFGGIADIIEAATDDHETDNED